MSVIKRLPKGLITACAKHRVAATLMVCVAFACGLWALNGLNKQFLPTVDLNTVTISVAWPGASPEDVESAITNPIENELSGMLHVKKSVSVSSEGRSLITMEFKQSADMPKMLQRVRNQVALVRELPQDSLKPEIKHVSMYEPIARVILCGADLESLRYYAHQYKQKLLTMGVAKVDINGLPQRQISIELDPTMLTALGMSLPTLSSQLRANSDNLAVGTVGKPLSRQLRGQSQAKTVADLKQLPIVHGDSDLLMRLADVASVSGHYKQYPQFVYYNGQKAIDLTVFRTADADALKSAMKLRHFMKEVTPELPQGVQLHVYHQLWIYIQDRINLLLHNGAGGLVLIFIILFLFLNTRTAGWVALGIPIAISMALFVLKLMGGSINMISLFALIMALGIIVDDTIVVAEESVAQHAAGHSPLAAVVHGAHRMLTPVLTSSLTTIAAFLPLLLLGGVYGKILMAIPLVIICVIIASLIEAFLILPSHLKSSFQAMDVKTVPVYRERLDAWFAHFRDVRFRAFVEKAIQHTGITLSVVVVSLLLTVGMLMGRHINFDFFPSPDGALIYADTTFIAGTSADRMQAFGHELEQAANQASEQLSQQNKPVLQHVVRFLYKGSDPYERRNSQRLSSVVVELVPPTDRRVTNAEFIAAWRSQVNLPPWVESFRVQASRSGPPGADIDISLHGAKSATLKNAALELEGALKQYAGVENITDDLPYAQHMLRFSLKPQAKALGLTVREVSAQLHAYYTGHLMQVHYVGQDEVEVRVKLSQAISDDILQLQQLPIVVSDGRGVPLGSLVDVSMEESFDALQHLNGRLSVNVSASVDASQANANNIEQTLKSEVLPQLMQRYGVKYSQSGRSADQDETLQEMLYSVGFALILIYIILACVSASYLWPVFVMAAIPLGLEGAVFGHWLLGYDLTLLSLFGFFGLTGIVINDSIILLFRYKELLAAGLARQEAIVAASCQRLRAVLLTSITTIAGLLPILFERSLQAQFLIPMAISICFGLVFSTFLILIVIPSLVSLGNK